MKVRVRVGKSRIAGQGLFTVQDIKKDTRIMPYVGERISKKESVKRLTQGNVYIFTFSDQYDIDGKVLGNSARYINHSCDPNCEVEITRRSIWIVAIRNILTGEELRGCPETKSLQDKNLCHHTDEAKNGITGQSVSCHAFRNF